LPLKKIFKINIKYIPISLPKKTIIKIIVKEISMIGTNCCKFKKKVNSNSLNLPQIKREYEIFKKELI